MGILVPAALALLALAIPIIIFYMLRLRREELAVSSSMLWSRALQDRTANAPWQRLRRNLLLLVQLLLLLLLVLTLARPYFLTESVAAGSVVVVLDASASMQATDEERAPSRFERARQETGTLIDGLQGGERMSILWAGPVPSIAASATGNKDALHAALRGLGPSNGKGDLERALVLAAAAARQLGDATVVLISDGVAARTSALPQMPTRVKYVPVGSSSRNVGITSLSLRDAPDGPQLFAGLYNSGPQPVRVILSISEGGSLRDSRNVEVPAGGDAGVTLGGLPLNTRLAEAKIFTGDSAANALAADDHAWAVRPAPPASNVLLVSEGNSFLEKALNLMPGVRLFKTAPSAYAPSEGFGLTVLDAALTSPLPTGNLLMFAPPNSPFVPVSGTISYPAMGAVAVNDPLMRFVDLSGVHIAAASNIIAPQWARVLARTANGEPLVLAGETDGRRVAVVAFDLHHSDLPLQVAFPILLSNLVSWLQPSTSVDAPPALSAGDAIAIRPRPEAGEVVVTGPDGTRTTLQPSGQASFAGTERLGVYTVEQFSKGKPLGDPEQFAVNLFSREESNIAPVPGLRLEGAEGQGAPSAVEGERPAEIWPWVLLAALVLLSVEWWLFNRPPGLKEAPPRPKSTGSLH